jgi:hypothetical protein
MWLGDLWGDSQYLRYFLWPASTIDCVNSPVAIGKTEGRKVRRSIFAPTDPSASPCKCRPKRFDAAKPLSNGARAFAIARNRRVLCGYRVFSPVRDARSTYSRWFFARRPVRRTRRSLLFTLQTGRRRLRSDARISTRMWRVCNRATWRLAREIRHAARRFGCDLTDCALQHTITSCNGPPSLHSPSWAFPP